MFVVASIRNEFPALDHQVYLNSATLGLPARSTKEAVTAMMARFMGGPGVRGLGDFWSALDKPLSSARKECAKLVGAAPDDIAFIQDTSSGLNLSLLSIPFEAGSNIVFSDLEYPQVGLSARHIQELFDVEIRVVPHRNGTLTIDDYLPYTDHNTKALLVSAVHWVNGLRMRVEDFSELARQYDIFLIIDGVQHMGVLPFDVKGCEVDFLVSGTHKWLNSPFNLGFMYINPRRREQVNPFPCYGMAALGEPKVGWTEHLKDQTVHSFTDCPISEKANRFETNSVPRWLAGAGLNASLSYFNSLDQVGVSQHILELGSWLIDELKKRNCILWTPAAPSERAGIISFRPPFENPNSVFDFAKVLEQERIYLSTRFSRGVGGIRISINCFNDRADLEAVLHCLDAFGR